MTGPNPSKLRVLARPAYSSLQNNPYTTLLYREVAAAGLEVVEYRPHRPWLQRYDVLHVHWPESVFDHTLIEAIPTTEALYWGAREAKRRGARLLWTVHNLATHEHRHAKRERSFMERFVAELDGFVVLTHASLDAARAKHPGLRTLPHWVVPHPHYRGQYADTTTRARARDELGIPESAKVLLVFGRMYEYKDVPALLRAARQAPTENWVVLVAGEPRTAQVAEDLRAEGGGDPRIRYHLRYIPSDEAQVFFRAADLVVQPYREILNSGTALLALSFDRPVLLPNHGAGADLAAEFGPPWVHAYRGELTPEVLRSTLDAAHALPERTGGEHLRALDVARIGEKMVAALRELATLGRP